jgi:hypothetical protein
MFFDYRGGYGEFSVGLVLLSKEAQEGSECEDTPRMLKYFLNLNIFYLQKQ